MNLNDIQSIDVSSIDEMIGYGKELTKQYIQKQHFFEASVFLADQFSQLTLYVFGNTVNLPYHAISANQSKTELMRFVAEKIHEMDLRTEIIDEGTRFVIKLPEEAYIQVLKEHYMVMPTEDIIALCREKIFVKHHSYIRPYKIEVNKDCIITAWGDCRHVSTEIVHKFGFFKKPKSLESLYIICHIINEYSGYKYKYSNVLFDDKYKYGEASLLTIIDNGDKFDIH